MAHAEYIIEINGETPVDVASANGWIFRPMQPVEIIRWGHLVTVALTAGTAMVITANHRQAGGAALTPSGAGDGGTVTNPATTMAVGLGAYTEVVSPRADITTTPFFLAPGEEMQFISGGEPAAGDSVFWVMYRPMWFQDATLTRAEGTDVLTAPIADATWLQNYTKVTA